MPVLTTLFSWIASPILLKPPAESGWVENDFPKLSFKERMRILCRAFAIQGTGLPLFWLVGFYVLKVALYLWLLWSLCIKGRSGQDSERRAFIRVVCFNMLWEVAGLGAGCGPVAGKFFPPFTGFFHFVYMGTAKVAMAERFRFQTRRNILDVLSFAMFLYFLSPCAFGADPNVDNQLLAMVCCWMILGVSDQTFFRASKPETYGSILMMLTLVSLAGGGDDNIEWLDSVRILMALVWTSYGYAKYGKTYPTAFAGQIASNPIIPPSMKILLFRDYPQTLIPSELACRLAKFIGIVQMTFSWGLLIGGRVGLISLVVGLCLQTSLAFVTLSMGESLEYELFEMGFMIWAFPLITGGTFAGVDLSNLLVSSMAYLLAAHIAVPLLGMRMSSISPIVSTLTSSARFATGDATSTFWFIERSAAETKLNRIISYSQLPTVQLQNIYGSHELPIELEYRLLCQRVMTQVSSKALISAVSNLALRFGSKEDTFLNRYLIVDGASFASFVLGWSHGDNFEIKANLMKELSERCELVEDELMVVEISASPEHPMHWDWTVKSALGSVIAQGCSSLDDLFDAT